MFKFYFILLFWLSAIASNGQTFETSEYYKVTATRSLVTDEILRFELSNRPSINCYIYHISDSSKAFIRIEPSEHELFDSVQVDELINPGLEGVKSVLRVEVEYSACCSWSEVRFFLVKQSGEILELPELHQAYCDWPAEINEYYFPSEHEGSLNEILDVDISINSEGNVDSIQTKAVLLWDGKSYIKTDE